MEDNVVDLNQERIDKEQPTIEDVITGFTAHNCDTNRPYIEQQPKRAQMEIKGMSRRDIADCIVLGILTCKPGDDFERIYVSEKGNKFYSFEALEESGEGYSNSYINPEKVTYNDLYGWDLDKIDPVAAIQCAMIFIELRMGVYPALLD